MMYPQCAHWHWSLGSPANSGSVLSPASRRIRQTAKPSASMRRMPTPGPSNSGTRSSHAHPLAIVPDLLADIRRHDSVLPCNVRGQSTCRRGRSTPPSAALTLATASCGGGRAEDLADEVAEPVDGGGGQSATIGVEGDLDGGHVEGQGERAHVGGAGAPARDGARDDGQRTPCEVARYADNEYSDLHGARRAGGDPLPRRLRVGRPLDPGIERGRVVARMSGAVERCAATWSPPRRWPPRTANPARAARRSARPRTLDRAQRRGRAWPGAG